MLRVATAVLPGVPSDHPHLFTGLFFPVADAYYGDMRYWLQVPADSSITSSEQWKVKQGDFLLLEADSRMWRDNAQLLDRRLCGIRLKDGPGSGCRLAEVRRNPDDGRLDYLDFAVVGTEPARIVVGTEPARIVVGTEPAGILAGTEPAGIDEDGSPYWKHPTRSREVDAGEPPTPDERKDTTVSGGTTTDASTSSPISESLAIDAVVAVCLLLVRTT
jgi:hypothetical protein